MKKLISSLLVLVAVVALVAVGFGGAGSSTGGKKAVLLTGGPVNDGGWNQMAYEGLKELEGMGFEIANTENVTQENQKNAIKAYADQGYNLIIGHGYEWGDALLETAKEYPEIKFFQTGGNQGGEAPNIASAEFKSYELGYLGGKLGVELTKSKKFGFVGAQKIPTVAGEADGLKVAVKESDPTIEVIDVYTGSWTDISAGKKAAEQLINQGVDVILGLSNACDAGIVQAIEEANAAGKDVKYIGCAGDFYESYKKDFIVNSCVKDVSKVIAKIGENVQNDKFEAKPWVPGFKESVLHLGTWSPVATDELKAKVKGIQTELNEGKITKKQIFALTGAPESEYPEQKGEQ